MELPPGYPIECERTARTRGGIEYRIRPIRPDDLEHEFEFMRGLSDETRYNRLMYAVHEPTEALLKPFVNIDYDRHMALIALMRDAGRDRMIGVARYVADAVSGQHEFAVVVTDEWQDQGIGTTLLRDLFEYASRRGLKRLVGTVLPANEHMLALARRLGLSVRTSSEDPSLLTVVMDLPSAPATP